MKVRTILPLHYYRFDSWKIEEARSSLWDSPSVEFPLCGTLYPLWFRLLIFA